MNIIKKHLNDSQYYKEEHPKTQIYLHHTVSSTFHSTYMWWQETPDRVGTAYVVDKNGDIYETFNPEYWSWHLGLGKGAYEKKSIGIELVCEGYLTKKGDQIYWLDGDAKYNGKFIEREWRDQKYWAIYPKAQFYATVELVQHLSKKFNIENNIITHYDYDEKLVMSYKGVLSHCNVRKDKTDISPAFDLENFKFLTFPPDAEPIDTSNIELQS